ncbi:MAG: 5'/3'-nucleotidase SurE [Anaerolineales bacterium]|nr:5'/3'-nucleotidase SurE [Anaerolineales bacterium]
MHILLTNDDGVTAPGLLALKQALEPLGRLTVVAPSRNYSAAGHRKTMHKPLRLDVGQLLDGSPAWLCSGAPSDCVALALLGFIPDKIDLVVSGINPHYNLGQDVTYSGTVTAAIEAVIAGVPGMAVSTEAGDPPRYEAAASIAARLVTMIAERGLPPDSLLNVNAPQTIKGLRVTRQGLRVYRDQLVERRDPRGKPYYWIGGEMPTGRADEGTDFWALEHDYVSVTPLQLDLTAYRLMPELEAWIAADL